MTPQRTSSLPPVVRQFVEDAGHLTQSLGIGRVPGLIYAYLYFSPVPRNLADMQSALGISKGSASTGVRQLEQWGAVKKVWVKGDRKDYYQASDWFGRIIKNAIADMLGKRISSLSQMMEEVEADLARMENGDEHGKFVRERVARLRQFQQRAAGMWESPLIQIFLK
jgi:HTH-type transcriptional regulator, glycine betaine synthesis regulator